MVRAEVRPEQANELTALADQWELPLLVQPRAGSSAYEKFLDRVRDLAPRLIVVDSYSMLLRPDVLEIPELGAANVHFAPLPLYRGPNPTQWSIINGERETGVTIHRMTEEVNTGEILAQGLVPIGFRDTWLDVNTQLQKLAEELLAETVPGLLAGTIVGAPQDEKAATRSRRRSPEDGLIDWDLPTRRIYDLVRALVAPLPGAFYMESGSKVVLDRILGIGDVASLKFDGPGGRGLGEGRIHLRPLADPGSAVRFAVEDAAGGGRIGRAEIEADWNRGAFDVDVEAPPGDRAATEALAQRFASEELLLG